MSEHKRCDGEFMLNDRSFIDCVLPEGHAGPCQSHDGTRWTTRPVLFEMTMVSRSTRQITSGFEQPTEDDLKRDALADLTVCNAATPGPWYHDDVCLWACVTSQFCGGTTLLTAGEGIIECKRVDAKANAAFAALARDALPAWIRRAVEAEHRLSLAKKAIDDLLSDLKKARGDSE